MTILATYDCTIGLAGLLLSLSLSLSLPIPLHTCLILRVLVQCTGTTTSMSVMGSRACYNGPSLPRRSRSWSDQCERPHPRIRASILEHSALSLLLSSPWQKHRIPEVNPPATVFVSFSLSSSMKVNTPSTDDWELCLHARDENKTVNVPRSRDRKERRQTWRPPSSSPFFVTISLSLSLTLTLSQFLHVHVREIEDNTAVHGFLSAFPPLLFSLSLSLSLSIKIYTLHLSRLVPSHERQLGWSSSPRGKRGLSVFQPPRGSKLNLSHE